MNEEKASPIPPGLETSYTFESGSNRTIPTYEAPMISKSGVISPSLTILASRFFDEKGWPSLKVELGRILAIDPASDILLADYRALRLRAFFSDLTTTLLNSIVSPDGSSNAARIFSSGAGIGVFSELARALMSALLSGTDGSISAVLRVYFMAVMPVPGVILGGGVIGLGRIVEAAGSQKPMPGDGRISTDRGNVSPE